MTYSSKDKVFFFFLFYIDNISKLVSYLFVLYFTLGKDTIIYFKIRVYHKIYKTYNIIKNDHLVKMYGQKIKTIALFAK